MSVVFHPLPTSCAPTAQSHPNIAHVPRKTMGLQRLSPLSLSAAAAAASSSPAISHYFSLRCICHHQAPPGTKPTITSASRRLTSAEHPGLPRKAPFFAAQPRRCSSGDGVSPLRRQQRFTSRLAAAGRPTSSKKEDKLVTEGLITELLPNCMFRVRLDNGEVILGYVSGKMRTKMVRVMVGDRVRIEVSRYDSTRGRIVFRLRSKSSAD